MHGRLPGRFARAAAAARRRCRAAALVAFAAWAALAPRHAPSAQPPPEPHWIFFRDEIAPRAVEAEPAPTPRAIARRERARRERERLGLPSPRGTGPIPAEYLAALRREGARVRVASGWLRAASVTADRAALERIRALPFVSETRPVARGEWSGSAAPPAPAAPPGPGASVPEWGDVENAGPGQRQLSLLGLPEAHALGYHGEGVLVGVLDTGFVLDHESFDRVDVRALHDFIQNDDDPENDRSRTPPDVAHQHVHGTEVLSLLAAYAPGRMIGAAYGASFLLAKTERSDVEKPFEEDLWCAGLEWAEAMGADVVTTSISFDAWYRRAELDGRTAVTTRMANLAWERGLVLVNAAGNHGPRAGTIGAPADAPGVITVGAVSLDARIAPFSSRGPTGDGRVKPDVVAPGAGVRVARPGTRDEYEEGAGTSFAAPLVAGVAALVVQAHPDWGPEAVREAIVMSADRADRPDPGYGWGRVNARDAILYPFLAGRVTNRETGRPIAGARVAWERTADAPGAWAAPGAGPGDAPPRGEAETDAGGDYAAANLPPGLYRLTIAAEGYAPATIGPFDVPPNLGGADAALVPAAVPAR